MVTQERRLCKFNTYRAQQRQEKQMKIVSSLLDKFEQNEGTKHREFDPNWLFHTCVLLPKSLLRSNGSFSKLLLWRSLRPRIWCTIVKEQNSKLRKFILYAYIAHQNFPHWYLFCSFWTPWRHNLALSPA